MSGVEVAGLVFGILPILVEVVKQYSGVADKLRTFRHYSKEVKSVRDVFRVRNGIFRNECRLLLSFIEDEKGTKDMMDDHLDPRWNSKEVNDRLNDHLNENIELCRDIIESSNKVLAEITLDLDRFNIFKEKKDQGESIKTTIKRLRDKVRITFDKSKFEKSLSELRDHNDELAQLRSHLRAFSQPKKCLEQLCIQHAILPREIKSIQIASQKLHEALSKAWCCGERNHAEHYAKLCLDGKFQSGGVRLDLAISCQEAVENSEFSASPDPPIWLYVQSVNTEDTSSSDEISNVTRNCEDNSLTRHASSPTSGAVKKRTFSDLLQNSSKPRKKCVRFMDAAQSKPSDQLNDAHKAISIAITGEVVRQQTSGMNLCHSGNICHYLKRNLQLCGNSVNQHCVGYLESPNMFKHMFYLQENRYNTPTQTPNAGQNAIYSISDLMNVSLEEALSVPNQLKLAYKTALAILQYNDTPWLSDRWRLKDLSYFGTHNLFQEDTLQSLHFTSQIANPEKQSRIRMEGIEQKVQEHSDEDLLGVNNMTLFSLGVALMELSHWKNLETLRRPKDPNLILTARQLAKRSNPLGPRYEEIVRKCLQCNFGFGTDLGKKELQAAVYGDVVCQLENMIKSLSL